MEIYWIYLFMNALNFSKWRYVCVCGRHFLSHDMRRFEMILSLGTKRIDEEEHAVDSRSRFRLWIPPTVADSISARSDMVT